MRFFATMVTMLLAALLLAVPMAAGSDEQDISPAVATLGESSAGYPNGAVLLARGGHGGHGDDRFLHGGRRGHGHGLFIHGGHRHPHHFKAHPHRHNFHHFDGHFGHFGTHRHFHPGFGVSFCFRDAGVLVCFNDHAFGHQHRW